MKQAENLLKKPLLTASLLLVLTLSAYYPSLIQVFFTQKTISLDDTKLMRGLVDSPILFEDIFKSYGHYYRPFINFSFWMDQSIWGANAFSFRLTNLLVHALNGLLVYAICCYIYRKEETKGITAFLSALIFSLHPAAVESTSWISGRTDLFAAFWSLLSTLLYFSGRVKRDKVRVAFALLLLAPAVLSKESAYATPLLFFSAELICHFRTQKKTGGSIKILLLIATFPFLYLLLKSGVYLSLFKNLTPPTLLSFFTTSIGTIFFYLKKFFYPFPLTFYIPDIFTGFYSFTGSLLLIGASIFYRSISTKNLILISWVFLGLLPSLYVALASPAWTRWAERYLYYSLAPLSILLGSSIVNIHMAVQKERKKYVRAAAVILVLLLVPATVKRSLLWNSNSLLWKNELTKNNSSAAVYLNYGVSMFEEKRYDDAVFFLKQGLKYPGMSHLIYFNLGNIARIKSEFSRAQAYYMKAIKEAESDPRLQLNRENLIGRIHSSRGHLFMLTGNFDHPETREDKRVLMKAAESFLSAFKSDRSLIYDLRMAARVFIRIGEKRRAIDTLKIFIARNPPDHYKKWAIKRISTLSESESQGLKQ